MTTLVITIIAVVAFAAVLVPLFRRGPHGGDAREFSTGALPHDPVEDGMAPMAAGPAMPTADVSDHETHFASDDEIEREVTRYRAAVRAGTVCRKCGQANPADSAFCFECGAALPRADVKEFE